MRYSGLSIFPKVNKLKKKLKKEKELVERETQLTNI